MKKLHAQELSKHQPILCFDVILQHDWPIETIPSPHQGIRWQEKKVATFGSFQPLADKTNIEHLPKPFFKVIRKLL